MHHHHHHIHNETRSNVVDDGKNKHQHHCAEWQIRQRGTSCHLEGHARHVDTPGAIVKMMRVRVRVRMVMAAAAWCLLVHQGGERGNDLARCWMRSCTHRP